MERITLADEFIKHRQEKEAVETKNFKVKWKPRHNHNDGDCWCDALALATGKTYDEVFEMMRPFRNDDGTLIGLFLFGLLFKHGYKQFDNENKQFTVRNLLSLVNHHECYAVVFVDDGHHAFYLHDGVIHDNVKIENREKFLDQIVDNYFLKPKGKIEA